jgi:hypothetical protein
MFERIVLEPTAPVRIVQGHRGHQKFNIHVEQKTRVKEMDDPRTPWRWRVHSSCSVYCQLAYRLCNLSPVGTVR